VNNEWQQMDARLAAEVQSLEKRINDITALRAKLIDISATSERLFPSTLAPEKHVARTTPKRGRPLGGKNKPSIPVIKAENGKPSMKTTEAIATVLSQAGGGPLKYDDLAKVMWSMDIPGKPNDFKRLKGRIGVALNAMRLGKKVERTDQGWKLL